MRSAVANSGTPMCSIWVALSNQRAPPSPARTRPPQLVTIAWKDSRATASIWRACVAKPNVRRTRGATCTVASRIGVSPASARRAPRRRPGARGVVREAKPEVREREHAQGNADPQEAVRRGGSPAVRSDACSSRPASIPSKARPALSCRRDPAASPAPTAPTSRPRTPG